MTDSDLEMVRTWRNHPDVSDYMFYQKTITKERQKSWFRSLDKTDVYLMIVNQGKKIGVINVKNINWWKRTGEAGVFIGDQDYRNSPLAMQAIFAMMDAFFYEFKFKALKATVKSDNENAIDFNRQLGYKVLSEFEDKVNMEVYRSPYTEARTKFTIVLEKFCLDEPMTELSAAEVSYFK
ncbi:MAG: GNAT family N-acetyltransferase [Crocinitomicaceae bacterium]|nr:GNAT family N-acetyltransferase [Crocinitomicaceae bacterium]